MQLIDETTEDLTALVEADFGPLPGQVLMKDDLQSWLHYKARTIVQRPRTVLQSAEVQALRAMHPAIGYIAAALRNGDDVSPWLSERVRDRKQDLRADLMFNEWQISHFHLGQVFEEATRISRSGLLLYAHIGADQATLIDIQQHGCYTRTDFLRILLRTDPKAVPEVHGLLPSPTPFTDEQRKTLRSKGISNAVEIDGRTYLPPGIGITGARTALRIRIFEDRLVSMIREVVRQVETNTLPWAVMQRVAGQIGVPVRLGIRFDQGVFRAYDKNRRLDLMYLPRVLV